MKIYQIVYGLDANIKVAAENFGNMLATKDSKKFEDVARAKNAYFAYLSLVRATDTAIVQYIEVLFS